MDPFGPKALATAGIASSVLAYRAFKKKTLTVAGAMTAMIVAFLLVSTGLRGFTLFFMYQLGSWATKYKSCAKAALDQTVATSSLRGSSQVLAVSIFAVLLSLYHALYYGPERPFQFVTDTTATAAATTNTVESSFSSSLSSSGEATLIAAAILAHHSISLADTLASEMGMAHFVGGTTSSLSPTTAAMVRLVIPPFRLVPPGTNGGVTLYGTLWSIVGGLLCGAFTLCMDAISGCLPTSSSSTESTELLHYVLRVIVFGGLCGGLGSLLDSILGATLQMTYWDEEIKKVCHDSGSESTSSSSTGKEDSGNTETSKPQRKHIAGWYPLLSNAGVNFVSVVLTAILGGWVLAPMILK